MGVEGHKVKVKVLDSVFVKQVFLFHQLTKVQVFGQCKELTVIEGALAVVVNGLSGVLVHFIDVT